MITEKFGFVNDENRLCLREFFKDNLKFKEIHIDMYQSNPLEPQNSFMLLLRTSEKDAVTSNDGNRLILKKSDKLETHFMNILFSKMTECFCKVSDGYSEFILNIQNVYYKITILN